MYVFELHIHTDDYMSGWFVYMGFFLMADALFRDAYSLLLYKSVLCLSSQIKMLLVLSFLMTIILLIASHITILINSLHSVQ